jgi:prepilin peptidase CpaA
MPPFSQTVDAMLVVLVLAATATDLRHRRIPNTLTAPAVLLGILVQTGLGGMEGGASSLAGTGLAIGMLAFPFAFGWLGGGDVKLLAAIGALKGPEFLLYTCLLTALFGGLFAAVSLFRMRTLRLAMTHLFLSWYVPVTAEMQALSQHRLPYAPAIALGTLGALLIQR